MGGSSSQVCWRQPWTAFAEALLRSTLDALGTPVQDLASQVWDSKTSTIGGIPDYKLSVIGPAGSHWSSILLHLDSLIGESLAEKLSALQGEPVFLFLEFEEATWGYTLFRGGQCLDHFWSDPEYVDEPPEACSGDPAAVAVACGIAPDVVTPYLRTPGSIAPGDKAFPDDEFSLEDHWVRVDFMRRLGIEYPDPRRHTHFLVKERGVW